MVPWLGFCTFVAGLQVQSLFRELRSHMPCTLGEKIEKKKRQKGKSERKKRGRDLRNNDNASSM